MGSSDYAANIIGHIANIFYLVGFAVKGVLWLRLTFIAGSLCELVYSYFIAVEPLWVNILWCGLYLAVNCVRLCQFLRDFLLLKLNPEEESLYTRVFRRGDKITYKKLLERGTWVDLKGGEVIVEQHSHFGRVAILHEGVARVEIDGVGVAFLHSGSFIGEISFLSGDVTSACVKTVGPCRLIEWESSDLQEVMTKDDALRTMILEVLNFDMISKLLHHTNEKRAQNLNKEESVLNTT